MYLRMFINQYLMGLKLHTRVPSAIFWLFAFPTVMLLGLGTVFGSGAQEGPKLVWAHTAGDAQIDDYLQKALTERGLRVEILSPEEAEQRWQGGKLAAQIGRAHV